MSTQGYIAFDLGAESGRAMFAVWDGRKISLQEVHRFSNRPQRLPSGYHWNLQDIWANLIVGLGQCAKLARRDDVTLAGVGIDTWGIDFALVGKSGQLLGLPFAYRDERSGPAFRKTLAKLGEKVIYEATGIQFMSMNSLYQLVAQYEAEPFLLEKADRLLMMPDLLNYFLTGQKINEATNASTTQMVDPRTGTWAKGLLEQAGLPTGFLGNIVPAGTPLGRIRAEVAEEAGISAMNVIAPGTHDTASAVAAVPVEASSRNWAYLSSGTWSLMGAELDEPVINDQSRRLGFTNERGVGDKFRFLKNIAGLWLVQECRRDFVLTGQEYSYAELTAMAANSQPFRSLVDPDHGPFASPGDMPEKIKAFAVSTDQPVPQSAGQLVRCCLESLALAYRRTLENLEKTLNRSFDVLHIVGGGGRNELLNQMTADAIGRPVIVGPYEATAVGNALTQAMGAGQIQDLTQIRQSVRSSFDLITYEPTHTQAVDTQVERFEDLIGR